MGQPNPWTTLEGPGEEVVGGNVGHCKVYTNTAV